MGALSRSCKPDPALKIHLWLVAEMTFQVCWLKTKIKKSYSKTKGMLTYKRNEIRFLWSPVCKYRERTASGLYKHRTTRDSCVSPLHIRLCLNNEKKIGTEICK